MPLPPNIAAFVADHSVVPLLGNVSSEHGCEGSKHHSPTPLYCEEVDLAMGAPDDQVHPKAWLCGTCRDNLRVLFSLMADADGALPWAVRREFGNQIRALAERAWSLRQPVRPA